jgi:16S rRNA G966 N2-methylase RsmD
MDLKSLLSDEVRKFVHDHENDDERKLVLKQKEILGIPSRVIAEQIIGRRKAKEKIPSFYNSHTIIYPPTLNIEQSSSEKTALFKHKILQEELKSETQTLVDLTGGFGVDTFYLSPLFKRVLYLEPDATLVEIVSHNHKELGTNNIQHFNTSAEDFLKTNDESVSAFFIDPSRRKNGSKVYALADCVPNIVELTDQIYLKSNYLLVKTSPLLDLQQGLRELKGIKKVFVVSVDNECKEVLFLGEKSFPGEAEIITVNILADRTEDFSFFFSDENTADVHYHDPRQYLYEPNASIMKGGAFKSIAKIFSLDKIHSSTHLYSADKFIQNFPGRIFKIEALVKPDAKIIKAHFPEGKANVTTRNYPLSVDELKKKTGLKDGGEKYLIGFSGIKEKFLAAATRIK